MKNKFEKQYDKLRTSLIKEVIKKVKLVQKKFKNDDENGMGDAILGDTYIYVDFPHGNMEDNDYENLRYISNVSVSDVDLSTEAWGGVDSLTYKELPFETLGWLYSRLCEVLK